MHCAVDTTQHHRTHSTSSGDGLMKVTVTQIQLFALMIMSTMLLRPASRPCRSLAVYAGCLHRVYNCCETWLQHIKSAIVMHRIWTLGIVDGIPCDMLASHSYTVIACGR